MRGQQFQDAHLGNREALAFGTRDQGRNNCHGQWNVNVQRGAHTGLALNFDAAASLLDGSFHDIHPYATP